MFYPRERLPYLRMSMSLVYYCFSLLTVSESKGLRFRKAACGLRLFHQPELLCHVGKVRILQFHFVHCG